MEEKKPLRELVSPKRNIKLDLRTWNALKNLKKANETFNDVVLYLLKERTASVETNNMKAIKYHRKVMFIETSYRSKPAGIEFEYNDVKGEQAEFTLDLKLKKIFFGKKAMNPSVFFGVDSPRKHFHPIYLNLYLKCVVLALEKEFRVSTQNISSRTRMIFDKDFENIARWRKIYYDYSLSEDSFISDIEEPLRLSEEEKADKTVMDSIKNSPSNSIWGAAE